MKRKLAALVAATVFIFGSITVQGAENVGFDANYYASHYPDVVNALGDSYYALYKHYVTFGINEGRYQNQYEEDNKIVNSSNIDITNPYNLVVALPDYSTYIDVDINLQVVTYFEDGVAKFQSPCVTGLDNGERNTPVGTYQILCKIPGKRLKGPTWDCWVDRWMRFTNNSIGIHDAKWRSKFGEDIYKSDGSHGCVNLPKEAAYELYDLVDVGTTVVVH